MSSHIPPIFGSKKFFVKICMHVLVFKTCLVEHYFFMLVLTVLFVPSECVPSIKKSLLLGDRFYVFVCAVCNFGSEFLRRTDMTWLVDSLKQYLRKGFSSLGVNLMVDVSSKFQPIFTCNHTKMHTQCFLQYKTPSILRPTITDTRFLFSI